MRGDTRVERVAVVAIDVRVLLERCPTSLYSHLVTRPTGRAVRTAIEARLARSTATLLSLIDFSQVTVVDFSCADEVVAKLIDRSLERDRSGSALFVFRGLSPAHREPIEAALVRRSLLAVVEDGRGRCELLGDWTPDEDHVWSALEARGRIRRSEVEEVLPGLRHREALDELVMRGVVLREPAEGYCALSALIGSPDA